MNINAQVVDFLKIAGVTEMAIAGAGATGIAITDTYPTQKGASYSFEYQLSGDGTKDVKVELEQGNVLPATQRAADANYVVPEDAAVFDATVADTLTHIKAYAPAATGYLRLKFSGQGSNAATVKLAKAKMAIILGS